ncbi:GNAT family N-acetyltransferase [Paenibacillus hemerocallicola]|uniref:GNAT family N-acetyltransferase n=1 Tax=Paenibacillus hemerocallicola TaxID=1172614 RepID=A0A5C4TBG9_9BACL|nr:GNAT family protein [Paenibacillus hemerocallicola]TNJ66448.1 GNAT family N-acetyltransferase [Paenibacillus hemerocallicola]
MEFRTERLIIRDFIDTDCQSVHAYASNSLVTKYMIWGPNTEEQTRAFIQRSIEMQNQLPRVDFELAVTLRAGGGLIGGVGIHVSDLQGEIGYCLNPDYWGRGYASEAAMEMIRFGFRELGLHRIYATCRPENDGSSGVMKKIGMTYEGRLREHMFHKGKWHDSLQYSILEHESIE